MQILMLFGVHSQAMDVFSKGRTPDRNRIFQDWPYKRLVQYKKKSFVLAVPTE